MDGLVDKGSFSRVVVAGRPAVTSVGDLAVVVGLVDRLPPEGEIAERLGDEVDVSSPCLGAVALDEEPAIAGEPARQREVVQADPRRHACLARR